MNKKTWIISFLIALFSYSIPSVAQVKHELLRRVVVFPLDTKSDYARQAEESWWSVREALTASKQFLVASKDFLTKKDVYQPRKTLQPADAIILGRLLDAHALVTTYLDNRKLYMKVYEGKNGRLLWEQELLLHSSLPVREQLEVASKKMIYDFMSTIPYQGFVVIDDLKGRAVYKEGERQYFQAHVGVKSKAVLGDKVQLIRVTNDSLKPLFLGGMSVETFAEGKIIKVELPKVIVELNRVSKVGDIEKNSFVKIPKEFERLRNSFALRENIYRNIDPNYFSAKMTAIREEERSTKPLVTSVSWIGNLALILLLAF